MKRGSLIILLAILVALASFGGSYFVGTNCCQTGKAGSEMEWLRKTFELNEAQFEKIKTIQESYQPTCERLCQRITTANEKLDQLIQSNQSLTPEVESALKESSAVREDCRKAMLEHIYRVATAMSPASRDRYIMMMKSRIIVPTMGHQMASEPTHCPQ